MFFLLGYSLLILSLPLLGLGSRATSVSPGFCDMIQFLGVRYFFKIFCFFLFDCFGRWCQLMWLLSCRMQVIMSQGPAQDPKCKLNILSFLTLPHLSDCLICAKEIMIICVVNANDRGGGGRGGEVGGWFVQVFLGGGQMENGYHIYIFFCSVFVLLFIILS